jgi:hypothetical protein
MRTRLPFVLAAGLCLLASAVLFERSAVAADPFYFGTWKITSATVAPWWNDPTQQPDPSEARQLTGKTIVIGAKGIAGPPQAACARPKYVVKNSPAEGLFQGMFEEMRDRDKSVDPRKVAASVGFHGSRWKTLETGCGNELDYHFLDENTADFGLNNYIYQLKKQ